ncbi:MAG: exo-alpha-sialidase [Bryobacterales bacterium]|nr:exo-alpha-sialidase [Bryobacterales bacterium]
MAIKIRPASSDTGSLRGDLFSADENGRQILFHRREMLGSGVLAGFLTALTARVGRAQSQSYRRVRLSLTRELVAGPETRTGRYKHPAAITELTDGDLYLVWFGGDGEYGADTGIFATRLAARRAATVGSGAWSAPVRIAHDPFRAVGNPVVWQAPPRGSEPGLVWLFYVIRYGPTWSDGRIAAKVSADGARTWSDTSLLTFDRGTLVRGKPIVLHDGRYLLPVYQEAGEDREFVGEETASFFLLYDLEAGTWTRSGKIVSRLGNLQAAPAEVAPGRLIAFCRRGGGYGERPDAWMVYSESHDSGMTWSPGRELTDLFPNPNAAVDLLTLRNGHLLLVYNHSRSRRTPLSLALSVDGGRSWRCGLDIDTGEREYAYPYAIQGAGGEIQLVYTSVGRTEIHRVVFREEDIEGKFPATVTLG